MSYSDIVEFKPKRDERDLIGKECEFNTHGEDNELMVFDGSICNVAKRVNEDEYDFDEIGTMWDVQLIDGTIVSAFADELTYI